MNLRLARKRAARVSAEATAAENRAAHGVPKALRKTAERQAAIETARLDGHRLEDRAARRDEPDAAQSDDRS